MRSVVTPGNFDGVHLGHRALARAAIERAQALSATSVALTFDPHPAAVIAPDKAPALLTTSTRRAELLTRLGVERVVTRAFDLEFAALSPEQFAEQVLVRELGAVAVVVGEDYRFGRGRQGDITRLGDLGRTFGFDVSVVAPIQAGGEPASSTRVRELVRIGKVSEAATLLDRYHDVSGRVVLGDQRGRQLGFPTANLGELDAVILPADGVYAIAAKVLGAESPLHFGVAHLGARPTVGAGRTLEGHLFDFEGDLYGTQMRFAFVNRLRGVERFANLDALRAQIEKDTQAARAQRASMREDWLAWM